ncbi:hypothetical protein [Micromonospora echinofusca]|uniref:Ig-like domain-containing protein n=1 Tax=Micromonospora echinofusca TaxID=47858 RepID=A0ABS3VY42_MICEH|nr:hypothetical protein [Micromonospora echinofusca]MBO4209447.1 hypothetical protein [Micromonospora echinofusca]
MRVPVLPRAVAIAVGGLLAVTGCTVVTGPSSSGGSAPAPSFDSRVGDGGGPTAEPTTGGTGSSGGTGTGGTGNSGGQPAPKPSSAAPNGPMISYFRVRQQPSCPAGTNLNPIPGTPVVLEWKVTNVDTVALSVDGPGVYGDNYPPTGTETINFPCSGSPGDTQRHTYRLTVTNAHGKTAKTIEVTAKVNEIAQV